MGATCSAVISAACHQPLPDDQDAQDAYKFPVQWGAVSHPYGINSTSKSAGASVAGSGENTATEETGSVPDNNTIVPGHCCFTTARDVERPNEGQLYA